MNWSLLLLDSHKCLFESALTFQSLEKGTKIHLRILQRFLPTQHWQLTQTYEFTEKNTTLCFHQHGVSGLGNQIFNTLLELIFPSECC